MRELSPNPAVDQLGDVFRTLAAHEAARQALEVSAPLTCAEHGGAEVLMRKLGGEMRPHPQGWWAVDFSSPEAQLIWGQLVAEQQAQFRECGE